MSEKNKARFTFNDAYEKLAEPFPSEALSTDNSRGFALTSVKAQYVVERLNKVLGINGWSHRPLSGDGFEIVDGGVIFKGSLIVDNGDQSIMQVGVGFSPIKKNVGDAYKSAKTDCLSKCASLFGVGNDVYKGKVAPPKPGRPKAVSSGSDF